MKKLNNVLIFLCSLAAACFFVRDLNVSSYDRLLGDITIPLVLLLPRIFSKLFKIYTSSHVTLFILHKKLSEKQFTIIKK